MAMEITATNTMEKTAFAKTTRSRRVILAGTLGVRLAAIFRVGCIVFIKIVRFFHLLKWTIRSRAQIRIVGKTSALNVASISTAIQLTDINATAKCPWTTPSVSTPSRTIAKSPCQPGVPSSTTSRCHDFVGNIGLIGWFFWGGNRENWAIVQE